MICKYSVDVIIDKILDKLLQAKFQKPGKDVELTIQEMMTLCQLSSEVFMNQPVLLELQAPLKICGDIHGYYYDLLRIFELGGLPPGARYLFLGNYVDKGEQSLETICLLLAFKIRYPDNIYLLRGNHECGSMTRIFGFYHECRRRYNIKLWKAFINCFNCLPIAAIIERKIFCVHGGLSPQLQKIEQINRIIRPTDVIDTSLLCDLIWSDPEIYIQGWKDSDRGISFTFGLDIIDKFIKKHGLSLICRGHQLVEQGYEFIAGRQLVTLFSAPN